MSKVQWEVGVFPHTQKGNQVVLWNSVVRRKLPDEALWTVYVMAAVETTEKAKQQAMLFLQRQLGQ